MNESQNKKEKANGVVIEALPNTMFRIELENGNTLIGYLAGKMRLYRIRVLVGDKVEVELDPYNDKKAKIVRRA
jgi:translation initiation factor IF-1